MQKKIATGSRIPRPVSCATCFVFVCVVWRTPACSPSANLVFLKKPQSSLVRKRPDAAVLETVWVLTQVPKAVSGLGPVLTLDTAGLLGWLTVAWTRDEAGKHQPLHLFPLPLPPP